MHDLLNSRSLLYVMGTSTGYKYTAASSVVGSMARSSEPKPRVLTTTRDEAFHDVHVRTLRYPSLADNNPVLSGRK
jgi:hypothetical protein